MTHARPALSVIVPTHNPDRGRLARTLGALQRQTFPSPEWELIVIDNTSTPPLARATLQLDRFPHSRIIVEPQLGLSAARRRGLREAGAPVCVFVDDDNALAPDYLAVANELFAQKPKLGCAGGKSLPEFEAPPPAWAQEFFPLLALRDLGDAAQEAEAPASNSTTIRNYPECAPIGAGMVLRREAADTWLAADTNAQLSDRRGSALSSSGDNDIVLSVLRAGWSVGYFPRLQLTHLIPRERLNATYLARLNRGVQESWMRVLRKHDANPWAPLTPTGALLRKTKAWLTYRPWRGAVHHIRWQGACGHFSGRVK